MLAASDATETDFQAVLTREDFMWASPKLDGIRAIIRGGKVLSRSLKPIPNLHVQKVLGRPELEGLDGELIAGEPSGEGVMSRAQSAFMTQDGEPNFTYFVFDMWNAEGNFSTRLSFMVSRVAWLQHMCPQVQIVPQIPIGSLEQIMAYEEKALRDGFEGLILKSRGGEYKHGRSTAKQGWMMKVKRVHDTEAEIIGYTPLQSNQNEPEIDALGLQKRKHRIAGMVDQELLGTLHCQMPAPDMSGKMWVFHIGSGFDMETRKQLWDVREQLVGKTAKFKYMPYGSIDAPRQPIFLGLRDRIDLDA
jgi:DNA ligase-1